MCPEQARKVARSNAQPVGQILDTAVIEGASLKQPERPFDRCLRSFPSRAEGRRFRPASKAGTVSGLLGRGGAWVETHVLRKRLLYAANRTAIDPGRSYGDEKQAVERRVASQPRLITGFEIEHAKRLARHTNNCERPQDDGVRNRPSVQIQAGSVPDRVGSLRSIRRLECGVDLVPLGLRDVADDRADLHQVLGQWVRLAPDHSDPA